MRAGALVAVAVLAALVVPSAAEARWGRAATLRGTTVGAGPVLASNQRGDVLMAWTDTRGYMRYAIAHEGGRFGNVRRIPGGRIETYPGEITAALAADGTAAVSWDDCREKFVEPNDPVDDDCRQLTWAAAKPRGHDFGRARILSYIGLDSSSSAVAAARGRATATYSDGSDVYGSRSGPGGRFRKARRIATGNSPLVALSTAGVETFFFTAGAGIKAVRRRPSGRLGQPRVIARPLPYGDPLVATGGDERVATLWNTETSLYAGAAAQGRAVHAHRLDGPQRDATYGFALAGAPSGGFLAAFARGPLIRSRPHRVLYTSARPGRPFSRHVQEVHGARADSAPHVALDSDGRAAVSWLDVSGGAVAVADSVHGRAVTLRRRYALAHSTDPTCERFSDLCDLPEVALDGCGHGYMAWRDGTRVRTARYTP